MLDISFNDSTGGNLLAIKYRLENLIKSTDIITLLFHFEYGSLRGDIYKTQANYEKIMSKAFFNNISEEELNSNCEKALQKIQASLAKIDKKLKDGEDIRLWISNSASDICGLYWLCDYVKNFNCKIYTVICPGIEPSDDKNKLVQKSKWAAFKNLSYMASFAKNSKELSILEINLYSELWQKLVKEDAPLRVLVDDKVVSTSEDFFDKTILSYVGNETKYQAEIICDFLKDWYCVDYCFVAERLSLFIKQGTIEVVEEKLNHNGAYIRTLKLK